MNEKLACVLVPVLTAVILLYQVLSSLQVSVTRGATLLVIGTVLAAAVAAGLLAAFGPAVVRVGVLALCTLLFLDVTFHLSGVFDHLQPAGRGRMSRDTQRIADIHRIKAGLDQYVARHGALPMATDYGEGTGTDHFWKDWWDVSSADGNRNGTPFLDFLVDGGVLPFVPVDPVNEAIDHDPKSGKQYVYFLVPPSYNYAGGACDARANRWHYMVAITDLEDEPARPPMQATGSGCQCLWREKPNYFQHHFDYILCGSFDATPERVAEARASRLEAASTAATRIYLPQDKRRVADIVKIQQGLEKYLDEIGPLPLPREYGEAEKSVKPGFWQGYWDVSTEDGDGDGRAFLDFLSESGVLPSVPVDPENKPGAGGDPRGGMQYVFYLAESNETYEGGTCAPGENGKWVYLLGITDLQSESERPPQRTPGSGCECLWRNQPNFFQQHFDYVVCGTFSR